jgi:MFS family permease
MQLFRFDLDRRILIMDIKKQTVLMYLYEAALAFRMVDAVWVIFLLERGFSLAEVGTAEGVYHITSMLFEVPSGMAADLFGRKRTLILSGIVGMCSAVFMTLEGFRGFVYCGMIFSALSLNLASGTEEALIYDSLLEAGRESGYKKVWSNISLIARTASALSCLASPIAIMMGYRYTYYISVFLYLCTVIFVLPVREPAVTERQKLRTEKETGKRYREGLHELGRRWKQHIGETVTFIRKNPKTMAKLFADAALGCPCYLIMMYLQEHLVNCGWPKSFIGIPLVVIPLAGALGTRIAAKNRSRLSKALLLCGIISGIGTCLVGSNVLIVVLIGACVVRMCEGFSEITVSENVNREFSSDYRATLVSVGSMCYSVLMVAASPVTGFLGDHYSVNAAFYLLGGGLLAATAVMHIVTGRKRHASIDNTHKRQF